MVVEIVRITFRFWQHTWILQGTKKYYIDTKFSQWFRIFIYFLYLLFLSYFEFLFPCFDVLFSFPIFDFWFFPILSFCYITDTESGSLEEEIKLTPRLYTSQLKQGINRQVFRFELPSDAKPLTRMKLRVSPTTLNFSLKTPNKKKQKKQKMYIQAAETFLILLITELLQARYLHTC